MYVVVFLSFKISYLTSHFMFKVEHYNSLIQNKTESGEQHIIDVTQISSISSMCKSVFFWIRYVPLFVTDHLSYL